MRKFAKILIPVLLLIAIVASCTLMFSSAADENVIYIAAQARGDGSGIDPSNAMGHGNYTGEVTHTVSGSVKATKTFNNTPYADVFEYLYTLNGGVISFSSKLYEQNAFYKAVNALKGTGGKIVVVDEVKVDSFSNLQNGSVSDTSFPTHSAPITVTSINGSDNFKSSGAKLVFDHSHWNSGLIEFMGPVVLKDLDIEYRYNTKGTGNWEEGFGLYTSGKDFTVDTGVTVTSVEYADNGSTSAGNRYMNIFAGRRFADCTGDPVITIKSGNWRSVLAAGHGINEAAASAQTGSLTGNVTINVQGGNVQNIYGGGSAFKNRPNIKVKGDLAINVTGGEVGTITSTTGAGVEGVATIDVKNPATVSSIIPSTATVDLTTQTIDVTYEVGSVDLIVNADKFHSVIPPFNPDAEKVIYISSTGTGKGKSPANPMGHGNYTGTVTHKVSGVVKATQTFNDRPYAEVLEYLYTLKDGVISFDKNLYEQNAFYRAFNELKETGGRIVIVGEVAFDIASTLQNGSVSDTVFPENKATITVTSIHGSDNYKNSGAKLIFDHSHWNSGIIEIMGPVVLKDLDVEYRYNTKSTGNWINGFSLYTSGKDFTVDTGVTVTSVEYADNGSTSAGDRYINILAGRRFAASSGNPVITIKSGTFSSIYGAGHSNVSGSASLTGNVTINVSGGKVASINGGGVEQNNRKSTKIVGNLAINITGGEVSTITAATSAGVSGDVDIDIKNPAKVGIISAKGANATANTIDLTYVEGTVGFINVEGFTKVDPPFDPNVEPPVIPDMQKVIYISANGTGDGSSPESPLGHAPGYKENLQKMYTLLESVKGYNNFKKLSEADQKFIDNLHKDNVLYRAFEKASSKDTVIVLVGDVAVDIVSSRMTYKVGEKQSPAELTLPASNYNVTITSVYGGQDYRNQAKLVLDLAACNTTFLTFKSATTIENINIEHRYNNDDKNYWSTPFIFAANCNKFVIGKNVKVTSFDTSVNAEGNWYPAIIGGHRFSDIKGDANVTIKSGTWSFVNAGSFGLSGTYGKIDGNATLNIEGGRIEAVYGTSSFIKPTASITKKLTINITGGFVEALYATAKNGATNEIVVNIAKTAERVAKAWGGVSEASIPANATINYDRSVTRDDEVKYWTTVNYVGSVENQPEPYLFTLYVANVSKGKGDGSSPENAMGHAEGYAKHRKQALDIIAKNKGTNTGLTDAQKAITGTVYSKNALYRALTYAGNKVVNQGGRIVVCGPLSIDVTDAMRKSLAEFKTPVGAETITITSYDGTTNFRSKGAKLVLDNSELGLCVEFGFPVILDNLTIEHKYNSKNGRGLSNVAMLAGKGNKITVGYNVKVIATDVNPDEEARVDLYPTIIGGHRYIDSKSDNYVIVSSGQWAAVVGGDWGSEHTGNATIGINGGKIGTVCGTTNPTNSNTKHVFNGSVWIGLWGGEVDNVYVVGIPGMIWGDASVGLGGTTINGRVRAVHPDYEGEEEIQAWVFNYTDEQLNPRKVIGFETPVPATGSALPYLAVVATVSLVGATALIVSKKKRLLKTN